MVIEYLLSLALVVLFHQLHCGHGPGSLVNGGAVAWEGEPVPTGTEIKLDGLRGIEVGLEFVDRGFDLLDFVRGWGFGVVDQGLGIGIRLSI